MAGTYPCAFGKYILLKPLAQGGMGELHLALTGELGGFEKLCVVKRVRAGRQQHESASRRFFDEAKVVLKLSNGNLVQVFDAGLVNDEIYLAMEYVEGRDLHDILFGREESPARIPVEVALYIAVQVCRGLDYAHGYGDLKLVHRDICPSNVLLSYSGEVKITDFGLAQSRLKEERTAPGKLFGRFAYLAPEQARRGEVDHRTDIYATAIILWELLVGRPMRPGPHKDPVLSLSQARRGKIIPPSSGNPRITPEIDAIVVKGLQAEPARRYADAEEMRRALAKLLVRLNPTFDAAGLAEFMRKRYSSEIEEARQERETFLSQNYDRWRRTSVPPAGPGAGAVHHSGEEENLAGQVVDGRYRVQRLIGEGGMGAVYEAEHVEIGRRVALKILHAIFSSHPETVARFRAEARAATRIGHPNIVEVTDSGTTSDGRVYFVMELLGGVDLAKVMAEDRVLPAADALNITLQICQALQAAHQSGIVHRDLKPENIFLTPRDGRNDFVKILDFGIAKNVELGPSDDRLTHPGIAMGTPEYMAPEQAAGSEVDHRIDVYATAALLYEMLSGHLPHEGDNLMAVLSKKASTPAPSPRDYRTDMPEGLAQILLRGLAADPADRFQTMAELAEALQPYAGEEGSAWDTTGKPSPLGSGAGPDSADRVTGAGRPPALATGPTSPLPLDQLQPMSPRLTGPGLPTSAGAQADRSAAPARRVSLGEVRLSDEVHSQPQARIALSSGPAGAATRVRPLSKGLAPTVMLPVLRRRPWMVGVAAVLALALVVTLLVVFWPGGTEPGHATVGVQDAGRSPAVLVRPDQRVRVDAQAKPSTQPSSQPRLPKLTSEEVERLLEWAKRAADGGRYLKPKGDNVIELLDRIEEGHPEYPAARALRRQLCERLRRLATRAARRRRFSVAERLLQAWMALDPLSQDPREPFFQVQVAQAREAVAKNRLKVALVYVREVQKMAPQRPDTQELLGDLAAKRRKWSAAVKHFEAALAADGVGKGQRRRLAAKLKVAKKRAR